MTKVKMYYASITTRRGSTVFFGSKKRVLAQVREFASTYWGHYMPSSYPADQGEVYGQFFAAGTGNKVYLGAAEVDLPALIKDVSGEPPLASEFSEEELGRLDRIKRLAERICPVTTGWKRDCTETIKYVNDMTWVTEQLPFMLGLLERAMHPVHGLKGE